MVPRADWRQPEMRALVRRMLPSLGSAAVGVVRGFLVLVVANQVAGGVVAFQLALGFFYLPTALGARPVAVALLPRLSRLWQTGKVQTFRDELVQSVALVIFLVVPAAVAMVVLSGSIASAVSVGAMAGSAGVTLVAASLAGLGLGVLGDSGFVVATNAAYARDDAISPLRSTMLGTAVALPGMASALFLVDGTAVLLLLGLSLSIGYLAATWHLGNRLQDQLPSGRDHLVGTLLKAIGASIVMVVPAYAIAASLPKLIDGDQLGQVVGLVVAAGVGLAVYVGLHRVWRSEELGLLTRSWSNVLPRNLD
jgi:putative peptidoglycan lipid II flippase